LRAHAEARGLLVGCAVVPERLDGELDYAKAVADQANILVAENAMKWGALRPTFDRFDFRGADAIVAFALTHNQRVRGHNLCWHESIPAWFAGTVMKENARQVLVQHIQTVAGRYAGKLHSWDVVNEAIDPASGRPDGLRKSPWLDLIGEEYIELAFRTARQADSTALLTYNDYGIEFDSSQQMEKRGQVLMLVKRLRARGVPIDAVGVQSHLDASAGIPGAGLRDFIHELRRMGLLVFVTELDVNDKRVEGSVAERDAAVARVYCDYLTMMMTEPNVRAVLTWGITDRYTWLNGEKYARADGKPQRPLPFDSDYRPAPAFFAERDALDTRPATSHLNQQ
jgi:endo-1,4-beta-xylanase